MRMVKSLETIAEEVFRSPFSEFPIESKKYYPTYEELMEDDDPVYSYIKFCEEYDKDPPNEEKIISEINHIIECPPYMVHYQLLRLLANDDIKVVVYHNNWGEQFGYKLRD